MILSLTNPNMNLLPNVCSVHHHRPACLVMPTTDSPSIRRYRLRSSVISTIRYNRKNCKQQQPQSSAVLPLVVLLLLIRNSCLVIVAVEAFEITYQRMIIRRLTFNCCYRLRSTISTKRRRLSPQFRRQLQTSSEETPFSKSSDVLKAPFPKQPNLSWSEKMKFMNEKPGYTEYENCVRRLYGTNMFHPVKMELENITKLYELLQFPLDNVCVVHIAGTNGKGSVAMKIAQTVYAHNPELTVGLFTSPHIASFRERMQILTPGTKTSSPSSTTSIDATATTDGLITEEEVVKYLPELYRLCDVHNIPATFFEITTALAFQFFAQRKADVVVLETGLGGRLDATNVITNPALSVITSIGLEHTRILGDTVELIALEKGGIIKSGRPVLVGPHVPHAVLRQCAQEKRASKYHTCTDVLGSSNDEEESGDYDVENGRIATAAIRLLEQSHPDILANVSVATIEQGTSHRPSCRFEHLQYKYNNDTDTDDDVVLDVILDVAHNPPAMEYLVQKLRTTYPNRNYRFVVGMSSDKDLVQCTESVLSAVENDGTRIHLVQASHPRAASLEDILCAARSISKNNAACQLQYDLEDRSVGPQLRNALDAAAGDDMVVICGSVFLMGEVREGLGFCEPRDSKYIEELAGSGIRHTQENFGSKTT